MDIRDSMFRDALRYRENAYAPYSHFKVGAVILGEKGRLFGGCNVENASYPCGTCAEAGAVSAMVAAGEKRIKEILIAADTECILPCGNCLQKIVEFGGAETLILSADLNGIKRIFRLGELLPDAFKAGDIKNAE